MIETTEFTSSTLYRYADIDVFHLCENLGSAKVCLQGH
jgi:CRISPR system Cascade subunit CasC